MNNHIKILDVFYGNRCNLACDQCDTRSEHVRHGDLDPDLDNIKESIVLANSKFDVENWSVLGGEPFLYLDKVIEIIKFIRNIEPHKTIFFPTNGLLLDKNLDTAAEIITKYNVWMQVCNHTAAFRDQSITKKILDSVFKLAEKTGIPKIVPKNRWWYDIMKYDTGTENWQEYLRKKQVDINDDSQYDEVWMTANRGIYYMEAKTFQSLHYFTPTGKPKPFESNDPSSSYWNSCPSCFCSFLYDKKIYKCAALGTLKKLLLTHDSLEDPSWKKYLNYNPIDLSTCKTNEVDKFSNEHYTHIDECTMCPENRLEIIKTEEKVLPMYYKKK